MVDFSPAYRLGSVGPTRYFMRLLAAMVVSLVVVDAARAGVIFLGPTPYLSRADSPFPVDGSNPNFYLEDFEDGELNTPGIKPGTPAFPVASEMGGIVLTPGSSTDSVDGDDGALDGNGNAGHSLRSDLQFFTPTNPPRQQLQIVFDFDSNELGFLPNHFGFVWTDGRENSSLTFSVTTSSGAEIQFPLVHGLGDSFRDGDTFEDRFVGVVSTDGIASVTIFGGYVGDSAGFDYFEIDHVQYGRVAIPEPGTLFHAIFAISLIVAIPRVLGRRRSNGASLVSYLQLMPNDATSMRRFAFSLVALAAFSGNLASAVSANLLYKLTAPDPQPGARFGQVLSVIDGSILVGEPSRFHPDTGVGRAYLFDGITGDLKFSLNNPALMDHDEFAGALTGGDGQIFVSARGLQERIYVFDSQDGNMLGEIRDPNGPLPGTRGGLTGFGSGLGYGDGSLLVTAPSFDLSSELRNVGQAYSFDGMSGQLKHTYENVEPKVNDTLGSGVSVAMLRDKVVIGAILDDLPGDDGPDGDNPGRVWVFDRDSGSVAFTLENPNPESRFFDWFGWSVAANEDIVVVGAREDGTSGIDGSGTVYVFDTLTGDLRHTLFSPQPEDNGEFGNAVAITPDGSILVGAWGTSVSEVEGAGHVYLFDGVSGDLLLDVPNPEPTEFASFGWSVTALDNRIVVGSLQAGIDDMPATGAVYVFFTVPEPTTAVFSGAVVFLFWFYSRIRRWADLWYYGSSSRRLKSCVTSEI